MAELNIELLLKKLSERRPIFHSEADFQHELAWEIRTAHDDARIRMEKPSGHETKRERIDIEVTIGGIVTFIELKYKKTVVTHIHAGEKFILRADSAQDICRYDFIKDVARLEDFVHNRNNKGIGYAIMLTNDDLYWRNSNGKVSAEFFIHEGKKLLKEVEMNWNIITAAGTSKSREAALKLKNNYSLCWKDYSAIVDNKKNVFKYLLLKIEKKL